MKILRRALQSESHCICRCSCSCLLVISTSSTVIFASRFLATHSLERELECRDEVRDIPNSSVLVLVPVIHFLEDVSFVFLKFTESICLDLSDLVSLPLQLGVKLFDQFTLLFQSLLLLGDDGLLNLF